MVGLREMGWSYRTGRLSDSAESPIYRQDDSRHVYAKTTVMVFVGHTRPPILFSFPRGVYEVIDVVSIELHKYSLFRTWTLIQNDPLWRWANWTTAVKSNQYQCHEWLSIRSGYAGYGIQRIWYVWLGRVIIADNYNSVNNVRMGLGRVHFSALSG